MFKMIRKGAAFLFLLGFFPATLGSDWIYTVVEGDNLWDFSSRHLDSTLRYESLRRLNNIAFPRKMQPGTRIRVPMKWIRSNPTKARIDAIQGNVELERNDGTREQNPPQGTELGLGDRLIARANSSVAIAFADQSRVTLHQNSQLTFDHLSAHGTTGMVDSRVRLLDGRLNTDVTPSVGPGSRFEIHTPSAISAVRGTTYRAAVDIPKGLSSFEVTGGRVGVSAARRSETVRSGFGVQVAREQAPTKPKPLLAAPVIDPVPEKIREVNWRLRWQPLKEAARYRVEIAARPDFAIVLWDRELPRPRVSLPDLPDGLFHARVRGIDATGLEGRDSVIALRMDTRPHPPVPLKPLAEEVLRGQEARVKWTASADAERYHLEIATDADFTTIFQRFEDLASTQLRAAGTSTPGTYYWRVFSIAPDGEIGPPSEVRSWIVKTIPEKVQPALSGAQDRLTASWRQTSDDTNFQIQIALDAEFNKLQVDELTEQASYSFDATPGQVRYLRIRVVESDGYLGPWGVVQRIDPPKDPTAWIVPVLGVLGILLL